MESRSFLPSSPLSWQLSQAPLGCGDAGGGLSGEGSWGWRGEEAADQAAPPRRGLRAICAPLPVKL